MYVIKGVGSSNYSITRRIVVVNVKVHVEVESRRTMFSVTFFLKINFKMDNYV